MSFVPLIPIIHKIIPAQRHQIGYFCRNKPRNQQIEYILIALVAFLTSILTFFSGFGLGTILLPAFLFFFPVDASRFTAANLQENIFLLLLSIVAAITGVLIGNRLLKKITLKFIRILVAILLILIAIALGAGLI